MAITKPDMEFLWAEGGALVEPSDVKKQTGWTAEVPPFQWENWIQNRQDNYLAHINERGIPEWDGNTDYLASGLSYVQGSDGKIYKSVAASGPATTAQNPTTDATDTYWTIAFADVGAFLTQAAADARYLRQTNNLSDLSNPSTARTNLGVQQAVEAGLAGSASNLKLSSTGLSALVTITADAVCLKNASNSQVVVNSVSVTPSLASSGANGLDTGTSAASTWYSVWVIWNRTTTAGLLSLSATSPTMPVGYTHKARVGWVKSDSTANKYPLSFIQAGRRVQYKVVSGTNLTTYPRMAAQTTGLPASWTAVSVSNDTPSTAVVIHGFASSILTTNSANISVSPNNQTTAGSVPAFANPMPVHIDGNNTSASMLFSFLLESSNIYWCGAGGTNSNVLACVGWEDNF